MTSVGGTTLSTDANGRWLAEQAWFDVPLSQGTGGGVSSLFDLPPWQRQAALQIPPDRNTGKRHDTGHLRRRRPVHRGEDRAQRRHRRRRRHLAVGAHLGRPRRGDDAVSEGQRRHAIGDINPLLYRIAEGRHCPPSAT